MAVLTATPSSVFNPGAWTGPANVYASDNVRATLSASSNNVSNPMQVRGFNFSAVPAGDTLNSVSINIEHFESQTNQLTLDVSLVDGATVLGTASVTPRTTEGSQTLVITGVTVANLKSATFGLRIEGMKTGGGGSRTFNVDQVTITADYSTPAPPAPAAKLETITDDFADGVLAPPGAGADTFGIVSEADGKLSLSGAPTVSAGWVTGPVYTLVGSSILAQGFQSADINGAADLIVQATDDGTRLVMTLRNGTVEAQNQVSYGDVSGGAVNSGALGVTSAWMRIREGAGSIFFDYSLNGTSWTQLRAIAAPAWSTDLVQAGLFYSGFSATTTSGVEFDNLNLPPAGTTAVEAPSASTTFSVRAAVTRASASSTFSVRAAVQATSAVTTFSAGSSIVTVSASTTWEVIGRVTATSNDTTWSIATAQGAVESSSAATSWAVRALVQTTGSSSTWTVRAPVAASSAATTFSLRAPVQAAGASTTWAVVGRVESSSAQTTFSIVGAPGQVASASAESTWTVRARVTTASAAATFAVRSGVQATSGPTTWGVRAAVAATSASSSWTVRARVTGASAATTFNVVGAPGQVVSTSATSTWSIAGAATAVQATSAAATWAVRALVQSAGPESTWSLRAGVTAAGPPTSWSVLTAAQANSAATAWALAALAAAESSTTTWSIAAGLTPALPPPGPNAPGLQTSINGRAVLTRVGARRLDAGVLVGQTVGVTLSTRAIRAPVSSREST